MTDVDLDALGAQYRHAKESIAEHRRHQARVEVACAEVLARHGPTSPEVVAARAAVVKATEDVRWCQAVTVAAGEAFKGVPFADLMARNDHNRADVAAMRQRALTQFEGAG